MKETHEAGGRPEEALVTTGRKRGNRPKDDSPPPPPLPPRAPLPSPIDWWKLDDEERAETLEVLGEWVPTLMLRYGLRDSVVPPCWYLHEALVQELLALFQYRNQQQVQPTAPPSAMLDFHYQFDLAIRRLTNWTTSTGCNSAEHHDTTPAVWVVPGSVRNSTWVVDFEDHVKTVRAGNAGVKE
ncbi:hypothetical protein [Leucobacter aridicollis]|uniref:hypothetical protein n=1 Tax=Leucobacter aridicollis TaxID=283878 RepID=UPI002105F242|nr:hypothetical protein [Leucobacter aridicollis]UTX53306.1 hypothetical protein KI794_00610 [Leucobacter aridicollis]